MRGNYSVTPLKQEEIPEMCDWMNAIAHRNLIDPDIFKYPATETLKCSNGKGLVYVPFQHTFFLESLALNPEASAMERAAALKEIFTVIAWEARKRGMGELYFLCSDAEQKEFVSHHGFKAMTPETPDNPMQLFRRKL